MGWFSKKAGSQAAQAPGWNGLKTALRDMVGTPKTAKDAGVTGSVATAFDNTWKAISTRKGVIGGVADRTAGVTGSIVNRVNGLLRGPKTGPAAIIGGVLGAGYMVKKHYDAKHEAALQNAMMMQQAAMQNPYMGSVNPQEYAAMEAQMRANAGPQGGFVQAEEARRNAAQEKQV